MNIRYPRTNAARSDPTLYLYLAFVVSWFLHLGSRIPVLGAVRFDLVLVVVLGIAAMQRKTVLGGRVSETDRYLRVLAIYAVATIPFVEWPGSVVNSGLPNFIKGVVFFYFTIAFVQSEADLRKLVLVFIACQALRVLEPLYLHITQGYWGAVAYMDSGAQALSRLSGAPSDVVNPNGLAFIICTLLPFLYFMTGHRAWQRLVAAGVAIAALYALYLTGSRSGMAALAIVFLAIVVKTPGAKRVGLLLAAVAVVAVSFPRFSADMQDRYLSLFGLGSKNVETAEGRVEGVQKNFEVALNRPWFGHGLGTSREANANYLKIDQPAHNLYAEVAIELGFVGLVIWLLFMKSIVMALLRCSRAFRQRRQERYLGRLMDAMQVWLAMNLIFSFASYGLSSYEWYLIGGITVVLSRLTEAQAAIRRPLRAHASAMRGA